MRDYVLICDDEASIGEMLVEVVKNLGYNAKQISYSPSCIEAVKNAPPFYFYSI